MRPGLDQTDAASREVFTLLLNDAALRQYVLAQPVLLAALIRHAVAISALDCASAQYQLAAYLDVEQLSRGTHTSYRQLALHLDHCPLCFELYRAACDIIAAQALGSLPPWPQLPAQPKPA